MKNDHRIGRYSGNHAALCIRNEYDVILDSVLFSARPIRFTLAGSYISNNTHRKKLSFLPKYLTPANEISSDFEKKISLEMLRQVCYRIVYFK